MDSRSKTGARRRSGSRDALETLRKVVDTLHQSLDFKGVADQAVDAVLTYTPFACASIYTLDEAGEYLELVASRGFSEHIVTLGQRLAVSRSLTGQALHEGQPLLSVDLEHETRGDQALRRALAEAGFSRAFLIPLMLGQRRLGAFTIVLDRGHELSTQERETLLAISRPLALAADNARYVERLRRSELRYAMATAAGKVGVWDWDMESSSCYLDPNVKALLGYADHEIPNSIEAWAAHRHPADRERLARAVEGCREARSAEFFCEHRMMHKDGSLRWILTRGNGVHGTSGRVTRVVATDVDITERKRLEQERGALQTQLLHAEKLKSLGVMAGGIAHDFNNLLTTILGNAELARSRSAHDASLGRQLEQIVVAADRAAQLTQQLLAYAGKTTFVRRPVDLAALVDEIAELLRISISKKARLEFAHGHDLPWVEGDPGQLRQVVMNVLTNASESLEGESGSIQVSTGETRIEAAGLPGEPTCHLAPGSYVFIRIRDDGCGMDATTRARLFDPFYTTKSEGRGLGLAAVQGIVHGHGGAISVESELRAGTTVTIFMPASSRTAAPSSTERCLGGARRGSGTILVVDDEPEVRSLAKEILEHAGFDVLVACDGHDAVEVFRDGQEEIRLVVLDLTMPRMSGQEALEEIQRLRRDTPVILCSGYSEGGGIDPAARRGPVDFLQKPYSPRSLVERVHALLDGSGS